MCDPVSLAIGSFAVSAAGSAVAYEGQVDATDAANKQAALAHRDASLAAERQYEDIQRKYIYESRANQQQGFNATMAGRQAVSAAVAGAGASGISATSVSIGDIINEQRRQTAQNVQNVATKQSDLTQGAISDAKSAEAQAQGRINSTPFERGPSKLGLMIDVAGAAINSGKQAYDAGAFF